LIRLLGEDANERNTHGGKEMTKKIQSPLVLTISILLLVTGLALAAPQGQGRYDQGAPGFGPGGHGHRGEAPMMGIFRDLDLTDEQREQVRATVREQMEGELGELMRDQRQAQRDLRRLIHDPAAEESAIIDAVQARTVAAEQAALGQHRLIVSLFEILTDEQREQALVLLEERSDDEFRPHHRGRRGGPPSDE
jgi:Spy/CpxP family protein refolding chaperone